MNMNESVFEEQVQFVEDDDVEIVEFSSIMNINSIKISKVFIQVQLENDRYVILIHGTGYRIFDFENEDQLLIREDINLGVINDADFMDNSAKLILLGVDQSLIVWDDWSKKKIKEYPLLVAKSINQITFSHPFLVASFDNNIIAIHQKLNQAYRYQKNIPKLSPMVHYAHNKDENNFALAHMSTNGQILILDNFIQQFLITIQIKDMAIISQEQLIAEMELKNKGKVEQLQNPPYPIYCAFSDDGNKLAVSSYTNLQSIFIYSLDWRSSSKKSGQLLYTLYRGQTKKELRMWFGPKNLVACISYDPVVRQQKNDATLHFFFDCDEKNDQTGNRSKKRYYFKTWACNTGLQYRSRDTLLTFIGMDQFRVISRNNFYFLHQFEMNHNFTIETIKDEEKQFWQNIIN